jgi:PAS domain S-box-containing protein
MNIKTGISKYSGSLKIVVLFFSFTALWFLIFEILLEELIKDSTLYEPIEIAKEISFILFMAFLLFYLTEKRLKAIESTNILLQQSEERYRNLVESSQDWVWEIDQYGYYTYVSPKVYGILGYIPEELIGKKPFDLMPENEAEKVKNIYYDIAANKKPIHRLINVNIHKDGYQVILETNGSPIFADDGSVIGYRGMDRDITRQIQIEKELKDAYQQLNDIIEFLPDATFVINQEKKVIAWNKAIQKMTGIKKQEIIGQGDYCYSVPFYGKRRPILIDFISGYSLEEKEKYNFIEKDDDILYTELYLPEFNNSKGVYFSCIASPLLHSDGTRYGAIESIRDITQQKLSEKALKSSELQFRTLANTLASAIIIYKENKIVYANSATLELTGYKRDELVNKLDIWDLVHPEFNSFLRIRRFSHQIEMEIPSRYEFKILTKNMDEKWLDFSFGTIDYDDGKALLGVAFDITERRQIEQALEESEQSYRVLVSTIPDIVIKTDLNGNIIFINDKGQSILDFIDKDQIIGNNILRYVDKDDVNKLKINFRLMFEKSLGPIEYKMKTGTKEMYYFEAHGEVLRELDGSPYGTVFLIRDINERKRAEQELQKYRLHLEELVKERTKELEVVNNLLKEEIEKQKEAEKKVKQALEKEIELSELKTRFISIASHEFRTPLATIFSSTELLEIFGKEWDNEKYSKQIARIKKHIISLTEIMDDVLTVSKIDSGKTKFEPVEINLKETCKNILDETKVLKQKDQKLLFEYLLNYSTYLLDSKLIKTILINLLTNAFKYSEKNGKIRFTVNQEDNYIQFIVSDNGIGIPEEDKIYLFDSFHRGSNVRNIHGTGLGLSIVKKYVEIHNGEISFISMVNEGTTFTVKIPLLRI